MDPKCWVRERVMDQRWKRADKPIRNPPVDKAAKVRKQPSVAPVA